MSKVVFQLPGVFDYQDRALFTAHRYAVVEGCSKAGKTYPSIVWLMKEAFTHGAANRAWWWVAPTHDQADIAYRRMVAMYRQADPEEKHWSKQDHRKRIEVAGVGMFVFKSGDEPDNLYGDDVYAVVMDEYTRAREESWHAVRSTLLATGGRVRLIGNVRGRGWGYRLARLAESGELKDWHYSRFTWREAVGAGILTMEEVEDARRVYPASVFAELFEAIPAEDGSNPFGLDKIAACVAPMSGRDPACWGVDLARTHDYTVAIGIDDAGAVCRFERWHGTTWTHTTERLVDLIGDTPAYIDSTGVGDPIYEQIQRRCRRAQPVVFTANEKQAMMERLGATIQARRITFPDNEIRRELEMFEFERYGPTNRVRYSAPSGMHDDCVCALALACKGIELERNRTPFMFAFTGGGETRRAMVV